MRARILGTLITLPLLTTFLSAASAAQQAKRPTAPRPATLKIRVGVVFRSGDVKLLARTDFFLIAKDRSEIYREAEQNLHLPPLKSFENYIDRQPDASPELKAWIKRNNIRAFGDPPPDWGTITVDDVFQVPEFHAWLKTADNPMTTDFFSGQPRRRFLHRPPGYPSLTGDKDIDEGRHCAGWLPKFPPPACDA